MNSQYDAVIIGAGVIGAATAFELAKRGYRTLNVDKLPAAGYGSTGATCAICRTHYSTVDGTALAHESFLHWKDWPNHLGTEDERGYARLIQTGMVGGLLIALYVAVVWGWSNFRDETNVGSGRIKINSTWKPFVRFIIPTAVGLVLLSGLGLL